MSQSFQIKKIKVPVEKVQSGVIFATTLSHFHSSSADYNFFQVWYVVLGTTRSHHCFMQTMLSFWQTIRMYLF